MAAHCAAQRVTYIPVVSRCPCIIRVGVCTRSRGLGKQGQGVSWTDPLKIGAEVRNCIWRFVLCLNKRICHLHVGLFPLYCIKNQQYFKGWGKNQRIVLHDRPKITWFFTLTDLLKMVPALLVCIAVFRYKRLAEKRQWPFESKHCVEESAYMACWHW